MELLVAFAEAERRSTQEQAAHIVSRGLAEWQAQRLFESTLPPMADDDEFVEAGAA